MAEAQQIQMQCPNCGNSFKAQVHSIIDAGQNPDLRRALLQGQLNVAVCPKCNTGVYVETPLVYHDAAADFLGVYLPPQLNLPEMERQKLIGEMTQALMRTLPPEQRKGYFFNPRQYINRQSFMDAILGTMGVTQEELDRQRRKMKLLDQALVMVDDPKGLQLFAKQNDADLDYEFFLLLSSLVDRVSAPDDPSVKKLLSLREKLLPLTSWGKKAERQQAAIASLDEIKTPDELLEKILAADPDEVTAITTAARPMLDYSFFEALTGRIDKAQGAERDRLSKLRERLLELTQQIDEATQETFRDATDLLRELVNAQNVRSAVREHAEQIDDVFMAVLSLNMQEAEKQGAQQALDRMQMIYDEIQMMIQEGMPDELRLISDLLQAPYPEGTRAMLRERQGQITPEILGLMDELAAEMTDREEKEAAKRLKDIKAQAMLLV